jgi:hypothetical protein
MNFPRCIVSAIVGFYSLARATPLLIERDGARISLQWASRPGQYFDIQRSENLTQWSDFLLGCPANHDGISTTLSFEDKPSLNAFFRVGPPLAKARITQFSTSNSSFSLTWSSKPGETFDIEISDNLADWSNLIAGIPSSTEATGTTQTFAKPTTGRFFRVVSAKSKPLISRVAWLGDSITAGETEADGRAHLLTGRLVHALLKQRITPVANTIRGDWDFGWSGFTSQQLISGRADLPGVYPVQRVIQSGADTCVVHIGTNNITWGQSVEMIVSSTVEVWDQLRQANIVTIGTEITPRSGTASVKTVDSINKHLKFEAKARGMIFAEWNKVGRLADGTPDLRYYMDGLHPNSIASSEKAKLLADLLNREASVPDFMKVSDAVSHAWISPNPEMSSSTPKLASSWGNSAPEGSTIEISTLPASDGGGAWQQLLIRQPAGTYNQGYLYVTANRAVRRGERFCGTLEMESSDDWDFKEVSISLGNMGGNPRDLYVGGRGGINGLAGPVARYQGILKTPVRTAAEDQTTKGTFFIHYWGSGTLRFRKAGIHLVP